MVARCYYFLCPDISGASGGMAVSYDVVAALREDGHEAAVVHMTAGATYTNTRFRPPTFYTHALDDVAIRRAGVLRGTYERARLMRRRLRGGPNPRLVLRPDDVLVVPEFMLSRVVEAFPDQPKIVFVQNSFSHLRTCSDALARGLDPDRGVLLRIGISDSCMAALDLIGTSPVAYCRVVPNLALFPYRADKSKVVSYMPRKRRAEARIIHAALERRGRLNGYTLQPIDGMPQQRVAEILGDSRIFISLLHEEALGFPAMEAMAAGCVVVGYTGFGTREYFTDETGIVIEEGNTAGLVHAVEAAIAEYEADPARLDRVRAEGARVVRSTYDEALFREELRRAWRMLDTAG
jgi:glycosyltransferase involved in cell wall biosynthesis